MQYTILKPDACANRSECRCIARKSIKVFRLRNILTVDMLDNIFCFIVVWDVEVVAVVLA